MTSFLIHPKAFQHVTSRRRPLTPVLNATKVITLYKLFTVVFSCNKVVKKTSETNKEMSDSSKCIKNKKHMVFFFAVEIRSNFARKSYKETLREFKFLLFYDAYSPRTRGLSES